MHRRILTVAGYIAWGVFCLIVSLYLTFPADALAQRLTRELTRQTHGAWTLTYGQASTYRLSGVALDQVTVKQAGLTPDALSISVDRIKMRLRLLPLFVARLSVDARVQNGNGELAVNVAPRGKDAVDLHVEADAFDLASPPLLGKLAGLPIVGKLTGTLDTSLDPDPRKGTGSLDMSLEKGGVGPGAVMGFAVPAVDLGTLSIEGEVKESRLRITSFKQKGGALNLQAKGGLLLHQPFNASQLELCMQVRAEPAFLNSNPKMRTVLQLAEVQLKKDVEGYLHIPLNGAVNAPHLGQGLCR